MFLSITPSKSNLNMHSFLLIYTLTFLSSHSFTNYLILYSLHLPLFSPSSEILANFLYFTYYFPTVSSPTPSTSSFCPFGFSEMGHDHHALCGHRLNFMSISVVLLIISSWIQQGPVTEGRKDLRKSGVEQEMKMVRTQIGSRPPRCERRCRWCGHCEAVQVPTNPQPQFYNSSSLNTIAYATLDDHSNYKPMSWKCKCGNLIFNP